MSERVYSMGRYGLGQVRKYYRVPARRRMRVSDERGHEGVITSGDGHHVRVRLDGEKRSGIYHPLSLDYHDGIDPADRLRERNEEIERFNDRLNERRGA